MIMYSSRGRLEIIGLSGLTQWSRTHPDGLVVVPYADAPADGPFRQLGRVSGFNYSKGKTVDLVVLSRDEPPSEEEAMPHPSSTATLGSSTWRRA